MRGHILKLSSTAGRAPRTLMQHAMSIVLCVAAASTLAERIQAKKRGTAHLDAARRVKVAVCRHHCLSGQPRLVLQAVNVLRFKRTRLLALKLEQMGSGMGSQHHSSRVSPFRRVHRKMQLLGPKPITFPDSRNLLV